MLRNVSVSNFTAYNTGNTCSSVTGIPNHFAENISLSHVQFLAKGGVSKNDYSTEIDEDEKGYPEAINWGVLPASGLFIRHAREITLDQVTIGVSDPDERVPVWAEDVNGLRISHPRLVGPICSVPLVKEVQVKNADIDMPSP